MTALFVTKRFFNVAAVYSKELQEKLANELTFLAPIKHEDELEARKDELKNVDYIFSTWGMPKVSEEEIDRFFPNLDKMDNWQIETQSEDLEENGIPYRYVDYKNLSPLPY